ncbi:hypothetical protein J4731_19900 [Providencia rettgeri]|nr:hypothetical protein [Providencia rettgeri]
MKKNSAATAGASVLDETAWNWCFDNSRKKGCLRRNINTSGETMCQMNKLGAVVAPLDGVTAMTDVTGFGLLGHLSEICEGSKVRAEISFSKVPKLANVENILKQVVFLGNHS